MKELKKKSAKENTMTDEKDESFEIISEKEKLWRDDLVSAETNFLVSEKNMIVNAEIIKVAKAEIKKEADKNEN